MKLLNLIRIANIESGIFGVLKDDGVPFCVTIENNDYTFPDGEYLCIRVKSPKFGDTFEIIGIPGRTVILFHWGNWENDSTGCVILGENYAILSNKEAIGSSKIAFREFLERTKDVNEFKLKVETYKGV